MRRVESLILFAILLWVCWIISKAWYDAWKEERERRAFNRAESLKPFPHLFRERPNQKYTTLPSADVLLDPQMIKDILKKQGDSA